MRITIESVGGRSGGGDKVLAAYESDALPAAEAGPVHRAAVAIATVVTGGRAGEDGAGRPTYRITIGDRTYELAGDLPAELSGPLDVLLTAGG
jgi:hypothetical protein